jgi:hypothetical protein
MSPSGILTGLRGQGVEVVRRTVYNGMLCMEDGAHTVVRDALANYLLGNARWQQLPVGGGEARGNRHDGDGGALAEGILVTVRHGNDSRRWLIGVREEG